MKDIKKVSLVDPVPLTVEPRPQHHEQENSTPIVSKFPNTKKIKKQFLGVALLVVLAGIGTGWGLSGGVTAQNNPTVSEDKKATGAKEEGINDESAFKDTAEGTLEEGGIDGEGTHHLVREGGPSKHVYLSSTVLNLDTYIGKKVQVWGQTISGRKAGWLMDVGKIKSLE